MGQAEGDNTPLPHIRHGLMIACYGYRLRLIGQRQQLLQVGSVLHQILGGESGIPDDRIPVDAGHVAQRRADGGNPLDPKGIGGGAGLDGYIFPVKRAAQKMAGRACAAEKVGELKRAVDDRLIIGMKRLHAGRGAP